jgi:hypothetical protein
VKLQEHKGVGILYGLIQNGILYIVNEVEPTKWAESRIGRWARVDIVMRMQTGTGMSGVWHK